MDMLVSNVSSFRRLALHTSDNGTTFTGQDFKDLEDQHYKLRSMSYDCDRRKEQNNLQKN